jgi:hypothetical protein
MTAVKIRPFGVAAIALAALASFFGEKDGAGLEWM